MKVSLNKISAGLALATLTFGSAGTMLAQTADLPINTFDSNANGTGIEWGSGAVAWNSTAGNAAGSLEITTTFGGSDTPCTAYVCLAGGNPWYQPQTVDLALYKSIDFDIKYDTTSDITIAQFNDLSTWPASLTNSSGQSVFQSWAPAGYLSGSTPGLDVFVCGPNNQMAPLIVTTNIPAAAASGWTHVSIPINPAEAGISSINGIVFHKWINQSWGILNPAVARVFVDNVVLKGTAGPPPPPKVSAPVKTVPGLNVFASTQGLYDRQSARLRQQSGLSWVGQATPANPVTYSFTVSGFPSAPATYGAEAYLFLIPNPSYNDNAPDWNETNAVVAFIQQGAGNATLHFQYKVNDPYGNAMYGGGNSGGIYYTNPPNSWDGVTPNYYESGNLASITTPGSAVGTWTIKFTSDTNGTLIAPNGSSTNFVFPAYNVGYFAEQLSPGFNVYLGMQANNSATINQSVDYANFAISNTAAPYSENFLADTALDTTNTWDTSVSSGPNGVLVVPTTAAEWLQWTLPASGFSLENGTSITNLGLWTAPGMYRSIGMYGIQAQLVDSTEVPAGNTAFFNLVKRTATQLQVLLPGETNAPGTATGKGGTPDIQAVGNLFQVTVNSVDATYHIVSTSDAVSITSSTDSSAGTQTGTLSGGTTQIYYSFDTAGSQTITATDTTSTNILSNTSSTVTAQ